MDDVCNDEIRLLDYPLVSVVDGKAFGDGFNAIRENCIGIAGRVNRVALLCYIGMDNIIGDRIPV